RESESDESSSSTVPLDSPLENKVEDKVEDSPLENKVEDKVEDKFENIFEAARSKQFSIYKKFLRLASYTLSPGVCLTLVHGSTSDFASTNGVLVMDSNEQEDVGEARHVGPYEFPQLGVKFLIHVNSPEIDGGLDVPQQEKLELLKAAYTNVLDLAAQHCQVAIPLLSAGDHGEGDGEMDGDLNNNEVIGVALNALVEWANAERGEENKLIDIVLFVRTWRDAVGIMYAADGILKSKSIKATIMM
ncbi:MAG: hypothetical protein SGARI_000176, partial [Bacillariaceae sp.]